MVCGVYVIRNRVDGKVYVGSAVNVRKRWNSHRSDLRRGDHHALRLQRAWSKHGEDAFEFELVEIVVDRLFLLAREQFWIWRSDCANPLHGYNVCAQAGSPRGIEWTAEQRARQREHGKRTGISDACRAAQRIAMTGSQTARDAQAKTVAARKAAGTYAHSVETRQKLVLIARRKLDFNALAEIKHRLAAGERQTVLAAAYGVHVNTISKIKNGKHLGALNASE